MCPVLEIEQLVDELERSYAETQERMSDPAVYNDREQASIGRRLKELEGPYRLAQQRRRAGRPQATRDDPELADTRSRSG